MVLSNREKILLAVLAAFVILLAGYFMFQAMGDYERDLKQRLSAREVFQKRAVALDQELARLRQVPPRRRLSQPLIGYVERLSARIQLKDRIQLNPIPNQASPDLQGIDIKVDGLSLDELVDLVYTLESADLPLVINQLEVSPSFRNKQRLRLTMRVLAKG